MDNEAPNYAKYMPEAGGYVANGKVVSKSPVYDENGKLKLDADTSQFPQSQQSPNVQVANNPLTNNGVTTANKTGSGEDVNSLVTNIGSMGTLNSNTATTGGVLTSPAMTSPNTNLKPSQISGKNMDDLLADFAYFQGENNYQGMINTLTQMSLLDGQDRTAQINELQGAREQKIMSMDNKYLDSFNQARVAYDQAQRAFAQAVASGDAEAAKQAQAQVEQAQSVMDQIQTQQEGWRDSVGYKDAMASAYNKEMQNNRIEYETTYMDSINNKIIPALTQLVGDFLNFQYDPSQDQSLLRAQAQTELIMRNNAAATGMYYSSTTQYAIAQAISELVPVYEKMAREEKMEQIQLLQSTASFLLNLEEAQFDMWRSQIQLQFETNQEKRRQWAQAVESSNARGYVTNEEAAILGVEPGSLSQQAREHEQELQEQLDAEARALQQKKILAEFNKNMAIQEYEGKQLIDKKFGVGDFKPTSSGGDSELSGVKIKVKSTDEDGNEIEYTIPIEYYSEYKNYLNGNGARKYINPETGEETILEDYDFDDLKTDGKFDSNKIKMFFTDTAPTLDASERRAKISQLEDAYLLPLIDNYAAVAEKDKSKAISSILSAYKDTEKYINWLQYSGLNDDQQTALAIESIDHIYDRIDQADGYDEKTKAVAKKNVADAMNNSNVELIKDRVADNYLQHTNEAKKIYVNDKDVKRMGGGIGYVILDGNKQTVQKDKSGRYYYHK